ncbi:hypothetical protein J8C08_08060 [Chloracidobacterium thermophilum]|uniref:Glycosyltransferase RgtA/B/C/D-like domain-containing protein n=1 Tax=Chloracidobacterium thermophilum (strain B) TaxID=981222 RepID=G2LIU9_CHLTF|nr:hypothetical protein Cabther_A1567 [Chloracidobacterium thermophilum B]QUV78066.1 hypothetical protein J8C08_08060 [Chloracidobacterium thermophilum]
MWRQAVLWLAVCVLGFGAGAVHQWQTGRIGVLGDYAYIVDTAWRIAQGEVMYRDFGLPHSPLTFHVQATLIRVFGFSYGVTAWYCTVVNVVYVLLTYGLVRVSVSGWSGVALCVPLVWLAPHCIYPHPFYDPDTCLLILLNLNLLQWVATRRVRAVVAFLGGVTTVLPALAKQNVGYPYVVLVVGVVVWWGWLRGRWAGGRGGEWSQEESKEEGTEELDVVGLRWFGAGVAAGVVGAVVWLGLTCGLGNYWRWVFASASRRLVGLVLIPEIYGNYESWALGGLMVLGWWLWQRKGEGARPSWVATASATLLLGPFVVMSTITWLCGGLFVVGYNHPLLSLWVPVMILTLVVGLWQLPSALSASQPVRVMLPWIAVILTFFSFLSQGHTKSSYGVWALFVLMVASVVRVRNDPWQLLICWIFAITLTLTAIPYVYRNIRLRYIDRRGKTLQTVTSGSFRGFTVHVPHLSNFFELLDFVTKYIPESEPVVCVPQEDPFYVMTGRRNPLPMVIFDRTATPFFPEDIVNEAERRQVKWVIVKRVLQIRHLAWEVEGIPEAFSEKYTTVARLSGYDILYRID